MFGGEEDAPPPPAHVLLVRVVAVVHALERRLCDQDGFLRRLSRQWSRRDEVRQTEFFQAPSRVARSYPVREGKWFGKGGDDYQFDDDCRGLVMK